MYAGKGIPRLQHTYSSDSELHKNKNQNDLIKNWQKPFCCASIILKTRNLDLVFADFHSIFNIWKYFFVPLRQELKNKGSQLLVPSLGCLTWLWLKYLLLFKLTKGRNQKIRVKGEVSYRYSFVRLILRAKLIFSL